MASKASKATTTDMENDEGVIFEFANGNSHPVTMSEFDTAMLRKFAVHGVKQKLRDCYAGADDADEAEKAFVALLDRIKNGEWTVQRQGGGGGVQTTRLAEALAEATGKTVEEAQAAIATLQEGDGGDEKVKALRNHKDIKPILARKRAEAAAAAAKKAAEESATEEGPALADLMG